MNSAAKRNVNYKNFDINKIVFTPIKDSSFSAGGISYGSIRYNYKSGQDDLYVMFRDIKLTRNLVDKFRSKESGGFHESEYCSQRYKAIISTKEYPEIDECLEKIDNAMKSFGSKLSNNSTIEYFVDNEGNPKIGYNTIVKRPTMQSIKIYKDTNKDAAKKSTDEIKKIIGNKIKLNLKVGGKKDEKGKYIKSSGKNALIMCNVRAAEGIELGKVIKNLDFFENTFKVGSIVDLNVKISTWWSSPQKCEFGVKLILNDITVKSLPSRSENITDFIDDDDDTAFGSTKLLGEDDEKNSFEAEKSIEVEVKDNDEDGETDQDIDNVVVADEESSEEEQQPVKKRTPKKSTKIVRKKQIVNDEDTL